jgi:hypothetical protein
MRILKRHLANAIFRTMLRDARRPTDFAMALSAPRQTVRRSASVDPG